MITGKRACWRSGDCCLASLQSSEGGVRGAVCSVAAERDRWVWVEV